MAADRDPDLEIRLAAFEHVKRLSDVSEVLTTEDLNRGFIFEARRIPLHNPQRGIFKPKVMKFLLSIKTVFPRPGNRVWYDDQRRLDQWETGSADTIEYAFMGKDPNAADNRWLREAMENQIPVIYFMGVAPGKYEAIFPVYIVGWHPDRLCCDVAVGPADVGLQGRSNAEVERLYTPPSAEIERRYAVRQVRQRLHQAKFREMVLDAYGRRCAMSGLSVEGLLDAAHIIPDSRREAGAASIKNGLPLSKLHHAAFDLNFIGVDPRFNIHVSKVIRHLDDGDLAKTLKDLEGKRLLLPGRPADYPAQEFLEMRYNEFKIAWA